MTNFIPAIFLAPLLGSLINGMVVSRSRARLAGTIAVLCSGLSFLLALYFAVKIGQTGESIHFEIPWIDVGTWHLKWGFLIDSFSSVMALMVTFIGTLIHLYSIGYMAHDDGVPRFFTYLNLFVAAMLILVTADNLLVMFVGWEGVGLCSYLLIGFWFKDLKNTAAGTKAFIVNRIGDAGFLLGIFMCIHYLGSLNFEAMKAVLAAPTNVSIEKLEWIGFLLFVGAMGKSAQIPLFVWLPDAMAGPTPVSALIHAATMVTAGVYLVCRMGFLYQLTPNASQFITMTGIATALFAATIATAQRDIKKVLAYSTISQLGLMFVAAGVGNYVASIFHVVTHAFFKAGLFLGAGSVIHALSGEQDIAKMGGLRTKLPATHLTFLISVLAIAGFPPLSGFFSKDAILYSVLVSPRGGIALWIGCLIVSLLTAYYMSRLYVLIFVGSYRGPRENAHPHESSKVMTIPLWILAVGAAVSGLLSLPHEWHLIKDFLGGMMVSHVPTFAGDGEYGLSENSAMAIATFVGVTGLAIGFMTHGLKSPKFSNDSGRYGLIHSVLKNKYWVDELYDLVFVKPFQAISHWCAFWLDPKGIDRLVIWPPRVLNALGSVVTSFQTGAIQTYLYVMVLGTLFIILYLKWGGAS